MDATGLMAILATMGTIGGLAGAVWFGLLRGEGDASADRLSQHTGNDDIQRLSARNKSNLSGFTRTAAKLSTGNNEDELIKLRKMLFQAGFRSRDAVMLYSALRTVLLVVLGVMSMIVAPSDKITYVLMGGLAGAAGGYYLPHLYVTNLVQKRQSDLMKGFPDALDLLVSCVEAGLGLDIAFRRVSDEIAISAPTLARELQMVGAEVAAGVPRAEAMRHLAERTGVDEVLSLVNVLVQAERFGTSVAKALRVHSEHVRTRRMQRAEEKAAQVSPKLTIIMILFILPCLMMVLMGPALIRVKNLFATRNASHGSP